MKWQNTKNQTAALSIPVNGNVHTEQSMKVWVNKLQNIKQNLLLLDPMVLSDLGNRMS